MRAIEDRDLRGLAENMGNILETVTIPAHPVIQDIKDKMMAMGAVGAMMSGSGSTTVDVTADDGGDVGDVDISSGDSKEESESSNAEEENGDTDEADKDGEQGENTEKESSEK